MDFHGINGEIVSYDDARLHLSDIGFRRGYSAFDYLRIVRGRPLFLEDHLDRFENSASILGLDLPLVRADLRAHLLELIERNGIDGAGLQLFLSGGPADDGFTPGAPQLYIYLGRLPRFEPVLYERGAKLITHRYLRDLPEAKTTNYLMAVHLGTAMRSAGAVDALYHDGERVLEATRSNLFVVTETGVLATPERDILAGVTRKNMLRALDGELEVELRDVSLAELRSAREAFLTSTTKGALPICWVDDRPVGDGRPGPVTTQVARLFEAWLERYLMN
ncbi:MAG: aminotransferase class IV [Truepera sp.]|nr:aminotransferase class IV [Truepera sp.]